MPVLALWLVPYVDKRVYEWQVKLCDLSLARAIPERFRDEYRAHYKALYKCPVYFAYFMTYAAISTIVSGVL